MRRVLKRLWCWLRQHRVVAYRYAAVDRRWTVWCLDCKERI